MNSEFIDLDNIFDGRLFRIEDDMPLVSFIRWTDNDDWFNFQFLKVEGDQKWLGTWP